MIIYLDYILVYGNSKNEHYKILAEEFERIRKSGVMINPDKCLFLQKT